MRFAHERSARQPVVWACLLATTWLVVALAGTGVAAASPSDQAVTYQLTPTHDGRIADAGLSAPLTQQWSITRPSAISYPLIVNGTVYVTTNDHTLYALNQATGSTLWSKDVPGNDGGMGLAYDRGQVFVMNFDGLVTAFDATTGAVNWAKPLEDYFATSPPTAVDGVVYVVAGGSATVYAIRESDGRVLWKHQGGSGEGSPAVDGDTAYLTYVCQNSLALNRATGATRWENPGICSGGGGLTPVVAGGRLFAREGAIGDDQILSATTGAVLGTFASDVPPASDGASAFLLSGSTLRAVAGLGLGAQSWQFSGDGQIVSAPLSVGDLVFAGSSTGELYALDRAAGTSSWSANVGAAIPAPNELQGGMPPTGLAAANGTIVVPAGTTLVAYRSAGAITSVPANTTAPAIDGDGVEGRLLAADVGIWSGLPSSYAYQWQRCDAAGASCSDIAAATGASVRPAAGDIGSTLRVRVGATNAIGSSGAVTTAPSAVVTRAKPVNQLAPSVSGTPKVGQTLTADHGAWDGAPTGYAFQWQRCPYSDSTCFDVSGATSATFVARPIDQGGQLRVGVVATNAAGDSDSELSANTPNVAAAPPAPPQNLEAPDFEGFLVEGETLSAVPGSWSDNPTSYQYQWYSCDADGNDCPDIDGATQQTYTLRASDVGRYVGVQVVATNAAGDSDPATSGDFGPIVQGYPALQSPPVISGTAQLGQTLSASSGSWTANPTSYSYQWYRCDSALTTCGGIAGAGSPLYTVAAADIGSRLIVTVIATNSTGDSFEEPSEPTAVVPGVPPANVSAPAVSGTAQQGATLVVNPGSWTNNPSSYAYQWLRCNSAGAACAPIAGETGEHHVIVAADVGSRLAALVTASNAAGRSPAAASPPTAVVLTALDITVTRISTRVRSDGSIAMTLRTKNPGALTATATAPSRSLAAKLCVRRCPKNRQLPYGKGSATLAKPATVTLVVKPNARAKRAVAKYRRIVVRVSVLFKSSVGNGKNTKASNVVVKKSRPKRAR